MESVGCVGPYPHVGTCVCLYNYMYTVLEHLISSLLFPSSLSSLPPSFPTPLLCLPPSPSSPLSLLSIPSSLLCVDMHVHLIITRGFLSLLECSPHSTTPGEKFRVATRCNALRGVNEHGYVRRLRNALLRVATRCHARKMSLFNATRVATRCNA